MLLAEVPIVESGLALLTLTVLEIILGIDNILVLSILTNRLPKHQQKTGRFIGLALAMGMRVVLLLFISSLTKLTGALFSIGSHAVSGRDLILIAGGLFLLAKAVLEIHKEVEGGEHTGPKAKPANFAMTMVQITLMDLVFSLDSVITAVGMARELWVMVTAVVVAIIVMMVFAGSISRFIHDHPTLKVLALSFLLLIGLTLIIEGARFVDHVPKGYLYFAMGFSFFVEMLNLKVIQRIKRKAKASNGNLTPSGG